RYAAIRQALEEAPRVVLQGALDDAGVVLIAVGRGEILERLRVEIEAELAVVELHGKIEDLSIADGLDTAHAALVKHAVHDVETERDIVEQRAVPVPDDVRVASHASFFLARRRGLDAPVCDGSESPIFGTVSLADAE